MSKHVYVVDTCVLIHDPLAIFKFQEHDIYLPLAVIDDLDEMKTRRDTVGWSAREIFRILDTFNEPQLTKGVKVNEKGGKLFIYNTEAPLSKSDRPHICRVNSDNAIIDACIHLKSQFPKRKVAIVTKDTGLRVRAISWQCQAENYRSDLLEDTEYTGIRTVTVLSNVEWEALWQAKDGIINLEQLPIALKTQLDNLATNEFVFFQYGDSICPSRHTKGVLVVMKDKSNGAHHNKPEYMGIQAKNIEQKCALEILADDNIPLVCLLGPAGGGKAQPLDANVLTPNGFKPMREVAVGDEVLTNNSQTTTVTGVFPQGMKSIYQITFSDGASTQCCMEHLWAVQTEHHRARANAHRNEWLVVPTSTIANNLFGRGGRKNYSVPMRVIEFPEATLPLDSYLLGILIGDGGLGNITPILSTADDEILFAVSKLLPPGVSPVSCGKETVDYRLTSGRNNRINPLTGILRQLSLMGCKSDTKFIPDVYLHSSVQQRIALLQGLMDTDGTCDKRGTSASYTTVSQRLADNIIWLVRSLGGTASVRAKRKYYTYNNQRKLGKLAYSITISVPPHIVPFRLSRKCSLHIPKTTYQPVRYITSVEYVGEKEAQCIMVDDPSHLYVTDNFIVTHNTILTVAVALEKIDQGVYDRIIVMKPMVPVGGQDMGALPGDKFEKLAAWLGPIKDSCEQLVSKQSKVVTSNSFEELVDNNIIEVEGLTYIQGRSLVNTFIIVDEVQNVNSRVTRMIVERCGKNSKVVLLGDLSQVENPFLDARSCGLAHAAAGSRNSDLAAVVKLTKVERSPLAAAASSIFSRPEAR